MSDLNHYQYTKYLNIYQILMENLKISKNIKILPEKLDITYVHDTIYIGLIAFEKCMK